MTGHILNMQAQTAAESIKEYAHRPKTVNEDPKRSTVHAMGRLRAFISTSEMSS